MFRMFFVVALAIFLASNFGTSQEKTPKQVTFEIISHFIFMACTTMHYNNLENRGS